MRDGRWQMFDGRCKQVECEYLFKLILTSLSPEDSPESDDLLLRREGLIHSNNLTFYFLSIHMF